MKINETLTKVKANMVGSIIGAGAGYLVAKRVIKTEKMLWTGLTIVAGIVVGAMISSNMKAKSGVPTASIVK
jgi:hypothetical protein